MLKSHSCSGKFGLVGDPANERKRVIEREKHVYISPNSSHAECVNLSPPNGHRIKNILDKLNCTVCMDCILFKQDSRAQTE